MVPGCYLKPFVSEKVFYDVEFTEVDALVPTNFAIQCRLTQKRFYFEKINLCYGSRFQVLFAREHIIH